MSEARLRYEDWLTRTPHAMHRVLFPSLLVRGCRPCERWRRKWTPPMPTEETTDHA